MPEFPLTASVGATRRPTAITELDVALVRDPGDSLNPAADLFRSPAFFRLHAAAFERAWYAVAMDASTGHCVASGWFAETSPGEARSGARGPFGAFHSPFAPLPISLATRLVLGTEEELRARQIRRLHVTMPPAAHEPEAHAEWMNVYLRLGYTAAAPDLSYHLAVSDAPLEARMNSGNRAVVRTAERKGLQARLLHANERADAYAVNVQNRARRGRRMTMTLEALLEMERAIPGSLLWFGAFHGDAMIAAAVCVRLSASALYVFYLGEANGAEKQSPVTLLVAHIYQWCADHGIDLLDLGIATEGGVPNEGLMAYKRNLGFDVSPRYTLSRELAP
jgi:Acetyltransferase (GNAT) domain